MYILLSFSAASVSELRAMAEEINMENESSVIGSEATTEAVSEAATSEAVSEAVTSTAVPEEVSELSSIPHQAPVDQTL